MEILPISIPSPPTPRHHPYPLKTSIFESFLFSSFAFLFFFFIPPILSGSLFYLSLSLPPRGVCHRALHRHPKYNYSPQLNGEEGSSGIPSKQEMVRRVGLRRERQIPNSIGWTWATSPRRLLLWNQWNQTMRLKPQERFSSTPVNTHAHTHTNWHKCIPFSLPIALGFLPHPSSFRGCTILTQYKWQPAIMIHFKILTESPRCYKLLR